jgi:NHLM bacteriocin system ABC transporter ATP-binding protein
MSALDQDLPATIPVLAVAKTHEALTLSDDGIWLVRSGRVHIFATQRRNGKQTSARYLLFTIEAPGVLIGPFPQHKSLSLVAVPVPGATLNSLEPDVFWSEKNGSLELSDACDRWIMGWLSGCARYLQNRPSRDLASQSDKAIDLPENRLLDGTQTLIWYQVEQGEGVLFDSEPVGGGGLTTFPLGTGGWLRAFSSMRLVPATTDALLRDGNLRSAIEAFHQVAIRSIATALNFALVDEVMRIDRRTGRLTTDIGRIMGDLGRMIGLQGPQRGELGANQVLFPAIYSVASRIDVKAQIPASVRRASADVEASLDDILRASGLQARNVRLQQDWWRESIGSMLAFRAEDSQPLALLDGGRHGYVIEDAKTGARVPVTEAVAATLSPNALVFYQPLPDTKLALVNLVLFGLQDCDADFAILLSAAGLTALFGTLPALASRYIFDNFISQHQAGLLWQVGVALSLIAVAAAIFGFSGTVAMARIRSRASIRLKAALWERLLRQPMAFFNRYSAPDLTLRINAAENIISAIHMMAHQSLITIGTMLVNVATMFWFSPPAAAAALGLIGLFIVCSWLAGWLQKRAFTQGEQAEGAVSTFIHALTNGIRKLRLSGAEDRAFVKWGDRFTRSRLKLIKVRRITNGYAVFVAVFNIAAAAAIYGVIALLPKEPVEMGAFFGFVTAYGITMAAIGTLGRTWMNLAFQMASVPYMQPLLDAIPERQAKKTNPGDLTGALEVNNVSFRYRSDGDAILAGVRFTVQPGEFVAIVGPTGCGKSTLMKLLLALEQPQGGVILYDQQDLNGLDVEAVRRQIGTVLQRPQLMPASLYENIRGASNATMEDAWEAAHMAGIADDIKAMPMGMYTVVSEGASSFSGGQQQRIAIARAIIRKPAFLFLDEATSALDNLHQAEVMKNLAELACSRIVVAHRLSTIQHADRIVVLDRGQVAETGTYQELLAANGLFAQMARRQILQ